MLRVTAREDTRRQRPPVIAVIKAFKRLQLFDHLRAKGLARQFRQNRHHGLLDNRGNIRHHGVAGLVIGEGKIVKIARKVGGDAGALFGFGTQGVIPTGLVPLLKAFQQVCVI